MIQYPRYRQHRFSSFQVIIAGFAAVDLVGALLLMLPIAAQQRCVTPFHEALFTSTSALCVTGLVVQDTGSYWSAFGQSVILLLIQIGGLGVITVGAAFALLSGRKISLKQRSTMAANSGLRNGIVEQGLKRGWRTFLPEFKFTTDNAAMIAMALISVCSKTLP